VRDAVLGLDTVLASGDRARCGARVVKNVTGYDMAKLYVGSLGTLGVIEKAWLRLKPVPLSCRLVELEVPPSDETFALALAAVRRGSARGVALRSVAANSHEGPEGSLGLVAEFAGEAPATEADADWLLRGRTAWAPAEGGMDAVRDLQGLPLPGGLRARVHVLPAGLAEAWRCLEGPGVELLAYPEPAVLHARFAPRPNGADDFAWLGEVLTRLDGMRHSLDAQVVIEEMPAGAPGDHDVFRGTPNLGLMRAIKDRFDPSRILNPGRFAGRI
jgi:glycolate oxidase FAD binding subunit